MAYQNINWDNINLAARNQAYFNMEQKKSAFSVHIMFILDVLCNLTNNANVYQPLFSPFLDEMKRTFFILLLLLQEGFQLLRWMIIIYSA